MASVGIPWDPCVPNTTEGIPVTFLPGCGGIIDVIGVTVVAVVAYIILFPVIYCAIRWIARLFGPHNPGGPGP